MDAAVAKAKDDRRNNSLLVVAAARGYLHDVEALVSSGASVSAVDKRGVSALHYAAGGDREAVAAFLLSRGADGDVEDKDGATPLHWATAHGGVRAAKALLARGVWAAAPDGKDDTPLHIAARANNADLVRALADAVSKSDLRDRNKRGLTPLAEAVLAGGRDAAAALVAAGASVADADCRGWPLLTTTAALGNADAVKWVLKAGGDVGAAGPGGVTALHAAAAAAAAPTIRALLDAGADVDALDADGRAPVDVLPDGAPADLKSTLARRAASKPPPPTAAVTAGAFASAASAFAALSPADRVAAATRWAALDDDDALEAATAPYPTAVFAHAQHARTARHKLTIHKAVCMLHDDDDWQEWAGLARVQAAVAAVRDDPAAVERYLHDPPTMHVLTGLKKLQAVAAVNGRHGVPFDALVTANCGQPDWRAVDAATLATLRARHDAHVAAAAAAAVEDDEVAAGKAAKAVMDAFERREDGGRDPTATASTEAPPAELTLKQRIVDTIVRAVVQGLIVCAVLALINRATAPKAVASSGEL